MTQDKVKQLIYRAIESVANIKKFPITLNYIKEKNDGIFVLYYTNDKIAAKVPGELGEFQVTIFKDTYEDMQTVLLDGIAKIPTSVSDETKIILRIAYLICIRYINNIREVFSRVNSDKSLVVNTTNANKWFKEL